MEATHIPEEADMIVVNRVVGLSTLGVDMTPNTDSGVTFSGLSPRACVRVAR